MVRQQRSFGFWENEERGRRTRLLAQLDQILARLDGAQLEGLVATVEKCFGETATWPAAARRDGQK